jgi:hypothetical protein
VVVEGVLLSAPLVRFSCPEPPPLPPTLPVSERWGLGAKGWRAEAVCVEVRLVPCCGYGWPCWGLLDRGQPPPPSENWTRGPRCSWRGCGGASTGAFGALGDFGDLGALGALGALSALAAFGDEGDFRPLGRGAIGERPTGSSGWD